MWSVNEPMTARRITRLRFLEQESEQLRSYKSDLEFCLINTKRLLSEILSAQVVISHRRIDSSGDTEFSSHIPLKTLESALEKNCALLETFKKKKKERDLMLGKVLISEQLAEETIRKEHEIIQETEEQTNDVKYVIDKKDARINNLKLKIDSIETQIEKLKSESVVCLGLSEDNLNLFKQSEKIKANLSRVSKNLQITETQTEELADYFEYLSNQLSQYKIFVKNPMIRNKKALNLGTTQVLDMTLDFQLESSDSSSSEVCFPDKLQIETKVKPTLPKLDFTKVVKQINNHHPGKSSSFLQLKSKTEFLEKKCKEKTEFLNQLREKIKTQLEKNAKLAENNEKINKSSRIDEKNQKKRRKRAMSNTLDYLAQAQNEVSKIPATEESEEEKNDSVESFANISSFNGSEVAKLDYMEPDSILVDYMHEIVHD